MDQKTSKLFGMGVPHRLRLLWLVSVACLWSYASSSHHNPLFPQTHICHMRCGARVLAAYHSLSGLSGLLGLLLSFNRREVCMGEKKISNLISQQKSTFEIWDLTFFFLYGEGVSKKTLRQSSWHGTADFNIYIHTPVLGSPSKDEIILLPFLFMFLLRHVGFNIKISLRSTDKIHLGKRLQYEIGQIQKSRSCPQQMFLFSTIIIVIIEILEFHLPLIFWRCWSTD